MMPAEQPKSFLYSTLRNFQSWSLPGYLFTTIQSHPIIGNFKKIVSLNRERRNIWNFLLLARCINSDADTLTQKSDSITRKKLIDSWVTCRRQASSALCSYTAVLFTPGRALMWHEYRLASRKAVICCWLIHRPVFDAHRHHEIIPTSFMSVMPIDYTVQCT